MQYIEIKKSEQILLRLKQEGESGKHAGMTTKSFGLNLFLV